MLQLNLMAQVEPVAFALVLLGPELLCWLTLLSLASCLPPMERTAHLIRHPGLSQAARNK